MHLPKCFILYLKCYTENGYILPNLMVHWKRLKTWAFLPNFAFPHLNIKRNSASLCSIVAEVIFVRIVHFQVKHFDYLVNESLGHRLTPPWGTCEPLEIVAVFDNALKRVGKPLQSVNKCCFTCRVTKPKPPPFGKPSPLLLLFFFSYFVCFFVCFSSVVTIRCSRSLK